MNKNTLDLTLKSSFTLTSYYQTWRFISPTGYIPVTGINVNSTLLSLQIGQTYNLDPVIQGLSGGTPTYTTLYKESLNTNIASINTGGIITANEEGHALIIVYSSFDYKIEKYIHVYVYQSVAPNGLKVGVDYYLKNKESNKYASVKNASTQSGTIIQQWQAETEPHFRFRVEYLGNNLYVIRPMSNESLALDVYNASSQSGAAVQQYTWNNTNAQKWYITLNADGTYRLSAACATNNALTVVTPYNQNGSSINSITYSGSNAQKWCFEEARNYTSTVNNYFDNAMNERWNATNSEMQKGISLFSKIASEFFLKKFGLTVNFPSATSYSTIADECPTATDINSECTCSGLSQGTTHTCNRNMLNSMSENTIPGLYEARVLWIGRITWEWDSLSVKHTVNGAAVTINRMSVLMFSCNGGNNTSFSNFYNQNGLCTTYLHELCHVFGAKDTYCNGKPSDDEPCSTPNCATCHPELGYSEYCIMDNWDTKPIIIGDDAVNIDDYLCDKCKEDIRNYLK